MERLIGAARESLTPLKCLLILALVANFATPFLWWDWRPGNIESRHAMRMLLFVYATATLMLDSLPRERIANMVTRGMAVLFIGSALGIVVFDQASQYTEFPYAPMLIVSFGVAFVGAVLYVWSARATQIVRLGETIDSPTRETPLLAS